MYMYFIFDTSCLYYFSCQHHMLSPASEKLGRIKTFWEETLYLVQVLKNKYKLRHKLNSQSVQSASNNNFVVNILL